MSRLQWFARTRLRLALAAGCCFLLALGGGPLVAEHIRVASTSAVENILIMTLWLLVAMMGSFSAGILVADTFFPWHWRRRVILGEVIAPPANATGIEAVNATKSHIIPFSILVVGFLVVSGYGIESLTGNFFAEYKESGYFRTVMRSDDESSKLKLVTEMGESQLPERVVVGIRELDGVWRDQSQSETIRTAAIDALAELGHSLMSSVEAWGSGGQRPHGRLWEAERLADLRANVREDLLPIALDEHAPMSNAALMAIGSMRSLQDLPSLHDITQRSAIGSERWMIALGSMGRMASTDSFSTLIALIPKVREAEPLALLMWAVSRVSKAYPIDPDEDAPELFSKLVTAALHVLKSGSVDQRCAAATALRYVGSSEVIPHFFKAFDAATADERCKERTLRIRGSSPIFTGSDETLRMVVLLAFRRIGRGQEDLWEWAAERATDPKLDARMQGHLRNLARSARGK